MFAGDIGVAEDAATGSAAGAFAVWLAVSGLVPEGESSFPQSKGWRWVGPREMTATVLVESGRPITTTVAGTAVHVASGTIRVP